jgi:outer membrane immunogenic protein
VIAPTWTGFYPGIGGGTAWGTKEYDWNIDQTLVAVGVPPLGLHSQGSHNINGGFFGGQIGYNYQIGWAVLGVQADAHWADLNGSGNCFVLGLINCNAKVESFGSVTAKLGGTIDHALVYAKGRWAWENAKSDINVLGLSGLAFPGISATLASSISENRSGWTWGAGVEYAFSPNWSAFIEYNYYDFGKKLQNYVFSVTVPPVSLAVPIPTQLNEQFHAVKVGVNYRFNWGAPLVARY